MKRSRRTKPVVAIQPIQARMIAPCGMDCALCIGHQREKNRCPGCNDPHNEAKLPHCVRCRLKNCTEAGQPSRFCGECPAFPCRRLRQLDQRYRTKYGMSMLENLEAIQAFGIRKFIAREKAKWACPACGKILCVHRSECPHCGHPR